MSNPYQNFDSLVSDVFVEAGRLGNDTCVLQAGNMALIVRDCDAIQLSVAWDDLVELIGPEMAPVHLRMLALAIKRLVAENRATLLEMEANARLQVVGKVAVEWAVDVVA